MNTIRTITLALAVFLVIPPVSAQGQPEHNGVAGIWTNPKGNVAVKIEQCRNDAELCGRVVWMKEPYRGDGSLKRDRRNPDPDLRDREICGLEILSGFVSRGDSRWERGRIYNPDEGQTYSATLELKSDEELRVRGYVLLSVFGKSQTWQRLPSVPGDCPGERPDMQADSNSS